MTIVAYARVSSTGQSLEVQREKLLAVGDKVKLYEEKQSGKAAENRVELQKALDYAREGDVFVVTKLDRLARSVLDLHKIVKTLTDKGVAFKALDQSIDLTTSSGRLMFDVLAAVAAFELDIRKERQMEGIAKVRKEGKKLGRYVPVTQETKERVRQLRSTGVSIRDIMVAVGLSRASVYRAIGEE